jgi:hypothetical protein
MLASVIALREAPEIWNAVPALSKNANTTVPHANTTVPPGRCRRCQCWLSVYRQPAEVDCWPCRDAARREAEGMAMLLAAISTD